MWQIELYIADKQQNVGTW